MSRRRQGRPVFLYLWSKPRLPVIVSAAFYQRLLVMAELGDVWIVVGRLTVVDPDLERQFRIVRCRWGFKNENFLTAVPNTLLFALWVMLKVAWRRPRDTTLVHTFQSMESVAAVGLRVLGYPWIADIVDLPEEQYIDFAVDDNRSKLRNLVVGWTGKAYVGLLRLSLRRASLVITIGEDETSGIAPDVKDGYKIPSERLLCVPNGCSPELLDRPVVEPAGDGLFRLFYVGALSATHGLFTLLEAVRLAQGDGLHLVLAGPSSPGGLIAAQAFCAEACIAEIVEFRGRLTHAEVVQEIEACHVGLYPFPAGRGIDGTIPIKVMEYLALRRPVIASDLSGIRHLVIDGENGLLVPPSDPPALAAAIAKLRDNRRACAAMGRRGPSTLDRYVWPRINQDVRARVEGLLPRQQ